MALWVGRPFPIGETSPSTRTGSSAFLNVCSFILLMFYVVDAVLLTERMVQRLRSAPTKWPQETMRQVVLRRQEMLEVVV